MSATSEVLQGSSDVGFLSTGGFRSEQSFHFQITQTLQFMTIHFKLVTKPWRHLSRFWINAEKWVNWEFLNLFTSSGEHLRWTLVFLLSCLLPGLGDCHLGGWTGCSAVFCGWGVVELVVLVYIFTFIYFLFLIPLSIFYKFILTFILEKLNIM